MKMELANSIAGYIQIAFTIFYLLRKRDNNYKGKIQFESIQFN